MTWIGEIDMKRRGFLKLGSAAIAVAVFPKIAVDAARTDELRFGKIDNVHFIENPQNGGYLYSKQLGRVLREELNHGDIFAMARQTGKTTMNTMFNEHQLNHLDTGIGLKSKL